MKDMGVDNGFMLFTAAALQVLNVIGLDQAVTVVINALG